MICLIKGKKELELCPDRILRATALVYPMFRLPDTLPHSSHSHTSHLDRLTDSNMWLGWQAV